VLTLGTTVSGTITGATNDYAGSCGTTNGPDVVYQFTVAGAWPPDAFIGVFSTAFNPTIYIALTCGSSTTCNDNAYTGVQSSVLAIDRLPLGTYSLIVDSPAGASGDFTVEVYSNSNRTAGDMCGEPLRGANGTTGNTCISWANDDYNPSCLTADLDEIVYYFVKETPAGSVTVNTCTSCAYDTVLFVRDDCDSGPDLSCANGGCGSCSSITTTLAPGIYFAFVDGWDQCGTFTLGLSGL
jgi:hypothetical protein